NVLTGRAAANVPRTTSVLDVEAGPFVVIDAPGAGEGGVRDRLEQVLASVRGCDLVVFVFDATVGVDDSALGFYQEVRTLGRPVVTVVNKIDLLKRDEEDGVLSAAERLLGVKPLPVSALGGRNVGKLLKAMVEADPRVLNTAADLLPVHKRAAAWSRITAASAVAAGIGLEPLPLADAVPLVLLQSALVVEIGKIYGYKPSFNSAKELFGVLGSGLLLRQGFRQLVKVVPGLGAGASAVYAAAGTAAIGYAAMLWYETRSFDDQSISVGLSKPLARSFDVQSSVVGLSKLLGGRTLSDEDLREAYRRSLKWFADSAKRGRPLLPLPGSGLDVSWEGNGRCEGA
ncbi:MAG: GTP-binding protein, partial [Armatimonadota bacterium]